MTKKLEVAIAAGGTAGHVNPALALAEQLRDRGHHVRFYGETRRLEGKLVPQAGFELVPIHVTGFDRERPWTLVPALYHLTAEKFRLLSYMDKHPECVPDVAVGFGAYIELPLVQVCSKRHIPIVLHEQNSVSGLANRLSARNADLIAIAQPSVRKVFEQKKAPKTKIEEIGNPVRKSVLSGSRTAGRSSMGIPLDAFVLLVFGGSLGAVHLNTAFFNRVHEVLAHKNVYIVHSTGKNDFDRISELVKGLDSQLQKRYKVCSYIDNMGDMLAAADVCISRSGASSVAEISSLGVPAILVPYPYATADHQTTNARFLVDVGAAMLVSDSHLDTTDFSEKLMQMIEDKDLRQSMHAQSCGLDQAHAAERLADAVEQISLK